MERLTNLEKDALEELLRMRVKRASEVLQAACRVPVTICFEGYCPRAGAIDYDKVWHVRQRISGDIEGEGGWCIDRTEARRLIRLVRRVPTEGHEITPLEREGLVEIGHVLIDGLLDGLTSALGIKLAASVPTLREDLGARAEGRPRGVCVSLSHRVNGERSVSKLGLTWTPTSAGALQRALALYVSPFLAQLTEFRS